MRCLRAILGVSRRDRISNDKVRELLGIKSTIVEVVRRKRLKWLGHVARKEDKSFAARVYEQTFPTPRPTGRPPKRWKSQISDDLGIPISTAERTARNRQEWRRSSHRERARVLDGLRQ